jgi:GNAT superfamily N-acetyltransferase
VTALAGKDETVFRAATASDIGAIEDIVRAAYAKWVPVIGREPLPMQADYNVALARHRFDLAVADGVILGLIETDVRGDHLWIENLAVSPAVQGQGIGWRLLAFAEELALARAVYDIRLLTNAAFAANLAFYDRAGYQIDRREDFMGGTTVHLWKQLTLP